MMESTEVERAATRATLPRDTRREVERRTRKQTNPHFVSENREKTILETGDTQRGDTTRDWRAASRLITRSSRKAHGKHLAEHG